MKTVLIIGSAPDAVEARLYDVSRIDNIVAINNAWRIRDDWNYFVHPDDFPFEQRPTGVPSQTLIASADYVPANNKYGGIIYAGATMVFSAAYWVLHELQPDLLLFSGCDMIYNRKGGKSHFYGNGTPDPLRKDPTLQSLEAKAMRLMLLAARRGCLCANMGKMADTRLTFPRLAASALADDLQRFRADGLKLLDRVFDQTRIDAALNAEAELGCVVESGDYWNADDALDADALFKIDMMWRATAKLKVDRHAVCTVLSIS